MTYICLYFNILDKKIKNEWMMMCVILFKMFFRKRLNNNNLEMSQTQFSIIPSTFDKISLFNKTLGLLSCSVFKCRVTSLMWVTWSQDWSEPHTSQQSVLMLSASCAFIATHDPAFGHQCQPEATSGQDHSKVFHYLHVYQCEQELQFT